MTLPRELNAHLRLEKDQVYCFKIYLDFAKFVYAASRRQRRVRLWRTQLS